MTATAFDLTASEPDRRIDGPAYHGAAGRQQARPASSAL